MVGAKGSVSGLANAFPELMVKFWNVFQAGQYMEAARIQMQVNKARQILHIPSSTNAACYTILKERGIDAGQPKLPILPVREDKAAAMITAYKEMELL
jgi:dihydrodipicolinate synthase/N-acetylneuraminate lyase